MKMSYDLEENYLLALRGYATPEGGAYGQNIAFFKTRPKVFPYHLEIIPEQYLP